MGNIFYHLFCFFILPILWLVRVVFRIWISATTPSNDYVEADKYFDWYERKKIRDE